MDFLDKEDRENLIIEYKHLHDDNWQRGQAIWIVNSILITGSLIAAFQTNNWKFLANLVSLILVIIATILHATGNKLTSIGYSKMKEIRKKLGMIDTSNMYETEIHGKWWYNLRLVSPYILFLFLIGVYLVLLLSSFSIEIKFY